MRPTNAIVSASYGSSPGEKYSLSTPLGNQSVGAPVANRSSVSHSARVVAVQKSKRRAKRFSAASIFTPSSR